MIGSENEGKVLEFWMNVASVAMVLLVLWFAFTLGIERGKYAVLFLGISFVLSVLKIVKGRRFIGVQGKWLIGGGLFFIGVFLAATGYLYFEYVPMLMYRAGAYTSLDVVVGAAVVVSLFLLIWKEGGFALFALIIVFLLYFYFGNYFPGLFHHTGFSVRRIVEETVLGFDGVYGIVLLTVSTWVAIFLIFAGLIQGFGSLDVIVKACTILFSRKKTFIPQIPVFASLIFGSFSGAATANVAGTGSFTIPLMKKFGIHPKVAGAIESVASSGGQIMPPLMGATAFLIASFLGVSYLHIAVVGFLPALLFYLTLAFSVYWRTAEDISFDAVSFLEHATWSKEDWVRLVPLILSVGVLFTRLTLLIPMMRACIEGIFVFVVSQLIYEILVNLKKKSVPKIFVDFGRSLLKGMRDSAPSAAGIGIIGASMGLIVRVLTATGLGPKLSSELVDISHGMLPLLLLLTMILCILFGMAVSTLAVYVLTTFIAAPAYLAMGIPIISTHFMIFYLGNMSFVTPPVAPAALVASGIAGWRFMATAWTATWLGLPLFLLGICFVYHPELLIWSWQTPIGAIFVFIGLIGAASAIHIRFKSGWNSILERSILIVCSFAAMFILKPTIYIPAALVVLAMVVLRLRKKISYSTSI
jgi:TRAP transporter 4TM/12TM fusion protein